MRVFDYRRIQNEADASRQGVQAGSRFIAGGTNLLDLMKLEIETPSQVLDINRLQLDQISVTEDGSRLTSRHAFAISAFTCARP